MNLRARWVLHGVKSPELPTVGQAIVASWWPGRYYVVFTTLLNASDTLIKALRHVNELDRGTDDARSEPSPNHFATHICRCNKNGHFKSSARALYEMKYSTLEEAQSGDKIAVDLLEMGRLKLRAVWQGRKGVN